MQSQSGPTGNASAAAASQDVAPARPPLTAYHWTVFILAALGWMFDCMGQRIFVLGREPAMRELLGGTASDADVKYWGGMATFILMIGWASGGIFFGMMSDRYGRVKVMIASLLAYTVFSGISGFARSAPEFLLYRFLFGLGVGGMFGAATTLLAESVPQHFRTVALGSMQAISAFGNMTASFLSLRITPGQENFWGTFSGWQVLFFAGLVPAVFAIPMWLLLKEPESWLRARQSRASTQAAKAGSISELFRHPRWRRSTLVGVCLGLSGMVGLWGIAFFSPELITSAFKARPLKASEIIRGEELLARLRQSDTNLSPAVEHIRSRLPSMNQQRASGTDARAIANSSSNALARDLTSVIQGPLLYEAAAFSNVPLRKATANLLQSVQRSGDPKDTAFINRQLIEQVFPGHIQPLQTTIDKTRSRGTMLQDVGALFGMLAFTFIASRFSRRTAFALAFGSCLFVVAYVFYGLQTETDVYWMLPLMGFATLAPFAGYSIYFPELFPTRLRGTGVGFCYNTVRYLAAPFPLMLGWLSTMMPFRTVAVLMCSIYLLGLVALVFAPETKGQPLPED